MMSSSIKNNSLLRKIRKLHILIKEEGLFTALASIYNYLRFDIINLSIDSYYIFETNLARTFKSEKPDVDVTVHVLKNNDENEIDRLADFWIKNSYTKKSKQQMVNYINSIFNAGDTCLLIKSGKEIVGMGWVGYQNNEIIRSLGKKIGLQKDQVIFTRDLVSKEFRGKKIFPFIMTSRIKYARNNNYNKALTYVGTNNLGAIKKHLEIDDSCRFIYHIKLEFFGFTLDLFPKFDSKVIWKNFRIK